MEYVTIVLGLIQQVLPLIGPASTQTAQVAGVVSSIIAALVEFAPLIKKELGSLYTSVKGIVTALRGVATLPDQIAALDAFEAEIDAAWDAIEAKLDPDAG